MPTNHDETLHERYAREASAISAAPAAQPEPVAWLVCSVNKDGSYSLEYAAPWREAAHEHINDAVLADIDGAATWVVRPAYITAPAAQPKCSPHGLRYKLPPLELTGYQVVQFADMARAADSLDAVWKIKELEPLSAFDEGGPCPGGIAVTTEGQPGYALLSATSAAPAAQPEPMTEQEVLDAFMLSPDVDDDDAALFVFNAGIRYAEQRLGIQQNGSQPNG